jgi:hypothetical protein
MRSACWCLAVPVIAGSPLLLSGETDRVKAADVLTQVSAAEARREADVREVVSHRRYVLRNKRWDKDAVMHVRMKSNAGSGKSYEIVSMANAEGLQKKVFLKLLEGEIEASRKPDRDNETAITAENYEFILAGDERVDGRECAIVQLKPKKNSKYLLDGRAWIDRTENAIVRVEGRTARSVSFWIGRPEVRQQFRKVNEVWVSATNYSVSNVKFLGRTELSIEYLDYDIVRRTSVVKAATTDGF